MEVLQLFGTDEHKEKYLKPLLAGEIASAFCMTEPTVASSDATNVALRMDADGDGYVLNGRKWFASNALHANCKVLIVMGKTNIGAATHRQQSMMVVPIETPGVTLVRGLPVFGYMDREGHAEILFEDVRVPKTALLAAEGDGFMISQARLGPGRIHHCMRSIGMAERALDLMIGRAQSRVTFGEPLANRSNIQDWIAEARIEIEMIRLLVTENGVAYGHRRQREGAHRDRRDQGCSTAGGAQGHRPRHPGAWRRWRHRRFPAGELLRPPARRLRLADGPDEVHKRTIARVELKRFATRSPSAKHLVRQHRAFDNRIREREWDRPLDWPLATLRAYCGAVRPDLFWTPLKPCRFVSFLYWCWADSTYMTDAASSYVWCDQQHVLLVRLTRQTPGGTYVMDLDNRSPVAAPPIRATVYVGRWPKVPVGDWPEIPTGTFSPTTATLVSGPTEAVLIDALYLKDDVRDLGDLIERTGKTLTTIYITHAHADHYLGIGPLMERFPDAKCVALPHVVEVDEGDHGTADAAVGAAVRRCLRDVRRAPGPDRGTTPSMSTARR